MKYLTPLILLLLCVSCCAFTNVKDYSTIDEAYIATPYLGELFFPTGTYILNKTLFIDKSISLRGEAGTIIQADGIDMVVYNRYKRSVFEFLYIRDIAFVSTTQTTNLLTFNKCGGFKINNVGIRGGYSGVYLHGCLSFKVNDVYTMTGYMSNGAPMPYYGIYADNDPSTNISNNANRFDGCNMRSCNIGMYITESRSQGGVTIQNATIEGNKEMGLFISGMTAPVDLRGLHLEANKGGTLIVNCATVSAIGVYETEKFELKSVANAYIRNGYYQGILSDIMSYCDVADIIVGRLGINVSRGLVGHYTTNWGAKVIPVLGLYGQSIVDSSLKNWSDNLPAGFSRYGDVTIKASGVAIFDKTAAMITVNKGTGGLSYLMKPKDYDSVKGKAVIISAWLMADSTITCNIYARYRGNVNADYYVISQVIVGPIWKRASMMFFTELNAAYADFVIGFYNGRGSIYVDDFQVIVKE